MKLMGRAAEEAARVKVADAARRAVEHAFAEANLSRLTQEQRASFARTVANALLVEMKTGDEARPAPPEDWDECIWCDGLGYVAPTCCECDVELGKDNRHAEYEDLCVKCGDAEAKR